MCLFGNLRHITARFWCKDDFVINNLNNGSNIFAPRNGCDMTEIVITEK